MKKLYALLFILGTIGLQLLFSFILYHLFEEDLQYLVQKAIDLSYVVAFICLYLFVKNNPKFLKKSNSKTILYIILTIVLWFIAPCLAISTFFKCTLSELFSLQFINRASKIDYSVIRTIIVIPILEEFIFRKFIFSYITITKREIPVSIITTSLLFALIHLNFDDFIFYFLSGVALSLIYCHSRTVILPIAVHILINLLVLHF